MKRIKISWLVVGTLLVIVGVGLVFLAGPMHPLRKGNSTEFWVAATEIKLDPEMEPNGGHFVLTEDGWAVYYVHHPHFISLRGPDLYRIPISEAMEDFDRIVTLIEDAEENSLKPFVEQGHSQWSQLRGNRKTPTALLEIIGRARLDHWREKKPTVERWLQEMETDYREVWRRSRFYLLNVVLEFCLLGGLIVFAFWPWLRGLRPWRWGLQVALAPILLMTPWYLGYSALGWYPKPGGILYPWIVMTLRGVNIPWTNCETQLFYSLPRVLDPLNQGFGYLNVWMEPAGPSPLFLVGVGLAAGALITGLRRVWVDRGRGKGAVSKTVGECGE